MIHGTDLVIDLILAALLGGAVGIQRQAAQKPAGFRTHLLVAVSTCAFAQIGGLMGDDRITASVLTGIGFIGAGAIFRSGLTAHGLTTASSIFTVAAIGVAIGLGKPYSMTIGVAVTVLTVGVLSISDALFTRIFIHRATLNITAMAESAANSVTAPIAKIFADRGLHFALGNQFRVRNTDEGAVFEMDYQIALPRSVSLTDVVRDVSQIPGVREVASYVAAPSSL